MRPALALLALPLLTACVPQVDATVPLSAVFTAGNDEAAVSVPATLAIPQRDSAQCIEDLPALAASLRTVMPITAAPTCSGNDAAQHYAVFATELAIIPLGADRPHGQLFVIEDEASYEGGGESHTLTLLAMRTYAEVAALVGAGTPPAGPIPIDALPVLTINLSNDTAVPAGIQYFAAFVDGEPVTEESGPLSLEPGGTVIVRLPDVGAAIVAQGNGYRFATIYATH